jgi:hypothetical protein
MKTALVMAAAAALVGAAGPSLAEGTAAAKRPVPHKAVVHKKVVRPATSKGVIYHPAKVVPKVHRVEDAPDFRA